MGREDFVALLDATLSEVERAFREAAPKIPEVAGYMGLMSDEEAVAEMRSIGEEVLRWHPMMAGLVEGLVQGFVAGRKGEREFIVKSEVKIRVEDLDRVVKG